MFSLAENPQLSHPPPAFGLIYDKEVIKEQPSYRNLSATATRVLQCTCPVAVSRKYFSAILTVQRQQLIKDNNYNSS
jgi:hypothetical protein